MLNFEQDQCSTSPMLRVNMDGIGYTLISKGLENAYCLPTKTPMPDGYYIPYPCDRCRGYVIEEFNHKTGGTDYVCVNCGWRGVTGKVISYPQHKPTVPTRTPDEAATGKHYRLTNYEGL